MARWLHAGLLSLVALAGCAATPAPESAGPKAQALEDGAWRLAAYGPADAPETPPDAADITLQLDTAAGQIAGFAGCNRYTGPLAVEGNTLSIGPLATTKKFCADPEGIMAFEQEYGAALHAVTRFSRDGQQLRLHYGDGSTLVFTPAPSKAEGAPGSALAALRDHVGAYPRDIGLWEHPAVADRLRTLLGKAYAAFLTNMEVQGPLRAEDGLLYTTGNKAHEGGSDVAALILDPAKDQIQVWLAVDGEARTYTEKQPPLPEPADVKVMKRNLAAAP